MIQLSENWRLTADEVQFIYSSSYRRRTSEKNLMAGQKKCG